MKTLRFGLLGAAGLVLALSAARADDKLPANDREFLMQAVKAGHAEVKFSELAGKHSQNEKVRELAKRLTDDHTAANKQLTQMARNQRVAVVAGFERDKRDIYMNLSKLNGADFDREYTKQMVEDHEAAIKLFEHEAKIGTDQNIKKFAEDTLPTLREHLKQAQMVQSSLSK